MKNFLSYFSLFLITLFLSACTKQAGVSSFLSLGRIADGSIDFSFEGSSGKVVNVGDVLRVKPSKLSTLNSKIVDCKIKEGTTALPSGFSINPLTCEIVGTTLSRMATTNFTLEVTNSLGKKSSAIVDLRVRAILSFSGTISGLTSGQSVAITLTVNGAVLDSQTISSDGGYTLQSLHDGDSYSITTIHNVPASYTCTPSTAAATVYANVFNNISCFGSGSRNVSATVQGLGATATVNLRLTSEGVNYDLTNAGNGSHNLAALEVGKTYTVEVLSTSTGYGCYVQSNSTGTVDTTGASVIQCAANGPYYVTVKVQGLNGSLVSFGLGSGESLSNRTNGSYTFSTNHYYSNNATVNIQNSPLAHTCTLDSGTKQILGNTNFVLSCTPDLYSIGGTLTINGGAFSLNLILETTTPSGLDSLTLSSSGSFTFTKQLYYKQNYEIFIKQQPSNKICSVINGTGTVTASVSNINITCNDRAVNDCSLGNVAPWSANGAINAMGCDGSYLYYGGNFTSVGPKSPGYAVFTKSETTPSGISTLSNLGTISKVLSDGEGRWYISHIKDGTSKISMLNSDFSINPNFNYLSSNSILDFVIEGNSIYARNSNSSSNRGIYKINRYDGSTDATFSRPTINDFRSCYRMTISGDWIYCAGKTGLINSITIKSIARFNKNTGVLDSSFNPDFSSVYYSYAITIHDGIIYASLFEGMKVFDSSGNAVSFPAISGIINTIKIINGRLTLGGTFTNRIMQLNPLNGYSVYNDLGLTLPSGEIKNIEYNSSENKMYVVGAFETVTDVSNLSRKNYFGYDLNTKRVTSQSITPSGTISSVSEYGTNVMVGGTFSTIKSVNANYLARFSLSDGSLDETFHPSLNSYVKDIIIDGGDIYLAGNFDGKFDKLNLVSKLRTFGFTPPNPNGEVTNLVKNSSDFYLIGQFTQVDGNARKYVAKVDSNGAFNNSFLDVNPNSTIQKGAFDTINSKLILAGSFTLPNNYIASINSTDGSDASVFFDSDPSSTITDIDFFESSGNSNILFKDNSFSTLQKYSNGVKQSLGINVASGTNKFQKISDYIYYIDGTNYDIKRYSLTDSSIVSISTVSNSSGILYKVNNNLFYISNTFEVFSIF